MCIRHMTVANSHKGITSFRNVRGRYHDVVMRICFIVKHHPYKLFTTNRKWNNRHDSVNHFQHHTWTMTPVSRSVISGYSLSGSKSGKWSSTSDPSETYPILHFHYPWNLHHREHHHSLKWKGQPDIVTYL